MHEEYCASTNGPSSIGQNPTGGTLSVERRRQIYAVCQKYDVIIVEDDPYWNLQYPSAQELQAQHRKSSVNRALSERNYNAGRKSSGYKFLDSLVPSYLSIDTDGRVVRLDTFSKTIAPGCRLGWITAQPAFIERLARISESSTQAPSGFVQAMVAELILGQQVDDGSADSAKSKDTERAWKMDGWVRWLEGLRAGYEQRMQQMCSGLEEGKYIALDTQRADEFSLSGNEEDSWEVLEKVQMYDFAWPTGGMFVWVKVNYESHPYVRYMDLRGLPKRYGCISRKNHSSASLVQAPYSHRRTRYKLVVINTSGCALLQCRQMMLSPSLNEWSMASDRFGRERT